MGRARRSGALAAAFARGAHDVAPGTIVLRAWSRDGPAACKEAALGAIGRGAVVVMAHGGLCAAAAIAGAHQQNVVGLRLSDFELPDVAAASGACATRSPASTAAARTSCSAPRAARSASARSIRASRADLAVRGARRRRRRQLAGGAPPFGIGSRAHG